MEGALVCTYASTKICGIINIRIGGYQCWNLKSTDEIRHEYLTVVNKLRKQIADGTADNKDQTKCPQGKNIYRLVSFKFQFVKGTVPNNEIIM